MPPERRRLFAGMLAAVGIVIIVGGLVMNVATGTSVRWGWLAVAVGFAMGMFALYLWIRLSD